MGVRWLIMLALTVSLHLPPANAEQPMRLGLYVVVDDMSEAKAFYRALFQTDPAVDYGDFVSFRFNESVFALFHRKAFTHPLTRGNNVVPYIQVSDIETQYRRVSKLAATMVHKAVVNEGPISLFMFEDPSGNAIEFYSLNQ